MTCRCCRTPVPVRPLLCPILPAADGAAAQGPEQVDEEEVVDTRKVAVLGEPIVGVDAVTFDERGQGALQAEGLPSPKEPTQAARDKHNPTHLPFELVCPICVACRRPYNHQRLLCDRTRALPLLIGAYGFIRNSGDDTLICVLAMKLYPYGVLFACVVPKKGIEATIVRKVASFINDMGLTHVVYRSDREPSIVSLSLSL